jgi:hypothetical protein
MSLIVHFKGESESHPPMMVFDSSVGEDWVWNEIFIIITRKHKDEIVEKIVIPMTAIDYFIERPKPLFTVNKEGDKNDG